MPDAEIIGKKIEIKETKRLSEQNSEFVVCITKQRISDMNAGIHFITAGDARYGECQKETCLQSQCIDNIFCLKIF